jgi:hypothetical protein
MIKFNSSYNTLLLGLITLLIIFPFPSYANSNDPIFQKLLERIARQLETNTETANRFITEIDGIAISIQDKFVKIASDKTDIGEKMRLKNITVTQFFTGPNATVQISSLHRKKITEKGIGTYLTHLAGLYKKFHTVEIKFDKNYFKLSKINHFYDGRGERRKKYFEFTVDMWQQFIGCYDDAGKRCYKDWTKKGFHMIFKDENPWVYRVKAITVEDTISFEEYRNRNR